MQLLDGLCAAGYLTEHDGALILQPAGEARCVRLGIELSSRRATRSPICRPCLDWSERRMHLAGALGAAVLQRMLALDPVRRQPEGRALLVLPAGKRFVQQLAA